MLDKLFQSKALIHKALDATWKKNEAISDNVANADTPGYKRKDVSFDELLKAAMNKDKAVNILSHPRHIPISSTINDVKLRIIRDYNDTSMRMDGNNVDIDKEMAELAKNSIMYNALAQMSGYSSLRAAIKEGR